MANIVTFIDLHDGRPTAPALSALGEARRVAATLGATSYALCTAGALSPEAVEELAASVGRAGADKLLLCLDATLAAPATEDAHGAVLAQVATALRPRLFLFGAGSPAAALGAALAIRTKATLFADAALAVTAQTVGQAPSLIVSSPPAPGADKATRLELYARADEAGAVALLAAGSEAASAVPAGAAPAELQMLSLPPRPAPSA